MRYDWIEDILAVIDTGSFARAAEQRNITQSAFARRIEAIEQYLGGPLFDRARKPIALLPAARALEPGMRQLRQVQAAVIQDAGQVARGGGASVTLACQHAITATVSPPLVRRIAARGLEPVRVRSGNRDECLVMALSGEADLVMTYAVSDEPAALASGFVERSIGSDLLMPVARPGVGREADGSLPVIAYPEDVFFGQIVESRLWSRLPPDTVPRRRAVTALTLAAYRYALDGLGVAWLPRSLIEEDLAHGRLVRVRDAGPDLGLDVRLIRLGQPLRPAVLLAWDAALGSAPGSEGFPDLPADLAQAVGPAEQ